MACCNSTQPWVPEQRFQAGFKKGHACLDHAFIIRVLADQTLKQKQSLHVLFLDIEKAFDCVP